MFIVAFLLLCGGLSFMMLKPPVILIEMKSIGESYSPNPIVSQLDQSKASNNA
ncbi:MAG: hypothetical protein WDZ91_00165 [Paenibacillaceae bacterium]